MKKSVIIFTVILILVGCCNTAAACTGFAVYSDKPVYGMNFDYADVPMKFTISTDGDNKVFNLNFINNGNLLPTAGMNNRGLFVTYQMVFPVPAYDTLKRGAENIEIGYLPYISLLEFSKVKEVRDFIKDRMLYHSQIAIHELFADKTGDAAVVEVGEKENKLVNIENNFLVMTNFSNSDFTGKEYTEVTGAGADRYRTAYEYIEANRSSFDLQHGFEVLKRTLQTQGDYPTQCSMLFDPTWNEIYIVLKQDFDRIWKVSLDSGTIETGKGFGEYKKMRIGNSGITSDELLNPRGFDYSGILYGTASFAAAAVIVIFAVRKHNKRKNFKAKKMEW